MPKTIYEILTDDHDYHRELLRAIDATQGASEDRRRKFDALKLELKSHAAAEEQVFYARMMEFDDGQAKARHSVTEHEKIESVLGELEELDLDNSGWLAKFRVLKDKLEHHMEEEEHEIFERAKKLISADEARTQAEDFVSKKAERI